jgi:parvulin-like peptidyl-prolyl isomerase
LRPALRASKDFAAAAKAQGLEAKDTQLITRGSPIPDVGVSPEIDTAAFTLPTGGVSDPVATSTGTVIVRVAERQEVTPDAFRTAKETFRTQLLNERRAQFFEAYMAKAKQAMKIQVNSDVARTDHRQSIGPSAHEGERHQCQRLAAPECRHRRDE